MWETYFGVVLVERDIRPSGKELLSAKYMTRMEIHKEDGS